MDLIELPYPPSVNNYWRSNGKRRFITQEGKKFKTDVADIVADKNFPKFGDRRLKVLIYFHPRDRRKADLDNRLKAILDSLQDSGVYDDDEQIDHLTIQRAAIKSGGGVTVAIEAIDKPLI